MNTTVDTRHDNVVLTVLAFCVAHKVDCELKNVSDGLQVVHLQVNNVHLITRLQDQLSMRFPAHAWSMQSAAVV